MKKIILPIIIFSLLFGVLSFAQEAELPDPGLTPDSLFYFFDTLGEKIGMFFTFGTEKKAEKAMQYAEEKLAEVKAMAEKNKPEAAEKANQKYQEFLGLANRKAQEAKERGKDIEELATLITEKTLKHQEILIEVFERVPEEAKIAIEKAIEASRKGSEEAVQAVTGAKKEELLEKIEEVKTSVEGLRETVDWNIYNNYTFDYKIKYPDNFFTTVPSPLSGNKNTIFEIVSQVAVTIQIGQNPERLSAIDWIEQAPDETSFFIRKYKDTIETIDINGKKCARVFSVTQSQGLPMDQWVHTIIPFETRMVVISKVEKDKGYNLKRIYQKMLPTFEFIEDETADWETYINEKYGYSFKYPPDCFYGPMPVYCKGESPEERSPECLCFLNGENPDRVLLQKDNLTLATFSVFHSDTSWHNPPPGTDLIEWLKEKFSDSDEDIPDKPNFEIDGTPAVRVYGPGSYMAPSQERIYFIKNDKLFIITMIDVDSESNRKLYNQILSSFKFEKAVVVPNTPGMLDIDVSTTAGLPYTIGWIAVSGAATYDLERDTSSSFSNPGTVYFGPSNSFSETLSPLVSTTYYFRVKACNNYGCSSWSKVTELWVEVPKVEEKPYIKVISPNGGEEWKVGNTYNITWTSKGVEKVNILLLGCQTKECTVETGMSMNAISPHYSVDAKEGSYSWAISFQNIGLDISKYTCFKIKIYEAFPGPEGVLEKFLAMIASIVNKLGILLTQTSDLVEDISDECFTIIEEKPAIEEKITVTSPNGEEVWKMGNTYTIFWESTVITDGLTKVNINLLSQKKDTATKVTRIVSEVDVTKGFYSWHIGPLPCEPSLPCLSIFDYPYHQIEIVDSRYGVISDVSDSCFTIIETEAAEPEITVTSPNGGEVWQLYSTHKITWTPDPESRYVHAYLEKMQQGTFITVGRVIPGGKGSIQWDGEIDRGGNLASPGDYYIKLVNTKTGATDRSDGSFKLVAANDLVKADLKIKSADGTYSDGPVTVETRTIQVSWSSAVADACRLVASSKDTHDVTSFDNLATSVIDKQILLPGNKDAYYVNLICDSSLYDGNTGSDLISVNILCPLPETPVLTDPGISVNSGESFALSWTGFIGGTLQRDTDPTFSNPRGVYAGQSLSPAETTTYYYRVNACNDCGCSSWSNVVDMKVIVTSITLTSPNGGEDWVVGKTYDIRWITSGYDSGSPIQIGLRDTRYDPNTGEGEALIVNTINSGSYTWTIPSQFEYMTLGAGNVYKIVVYMEGIGGDTSDLCFSIVSPSITLTSPSGGEKWKLGETYQITWDSDGIKDIQIQVIGPVPDLMTISLPSNPSYYNWTIGSDFPIDSNYKVYISGTGYDNQTYADWMDPSNSFSVIPSITVTSPNGGEQWIKGNTYDIAWTSLEVDNVHIDVDFHGNSGIHTYNLVSNIPSVPGSWSWTLGAKHSDLPTGDRVKITVIPYPLGDDAWYIHDESDGYFSITEP